MPPKIIDVEIGEDVRAIGRIGEALAVELEEVQAMSICPCSGTQRVLLLTDRPSGTMTGLTEEGFEAHELDCLIMDLPGNPEVLGEVLQRIEDADAGVLGVLTTTHGHVAVAVENYARAAEAAGRDVVVTTEERVTPG